MRTNKKGRPYRHIKAQKKVKQRDEFCIWCLLEGKLNRDGLEGDHAVPYALGGSSDGTNMRALCEAHHKRRHGKTPKSEEGKQESESVDIELY